MPSHGERSIYTHAANAQNKRIKMITQVPRQISDKKTGYITYDIPALAKWQASQKVDVTKQLTRDTATVDLRAYNDMFQSRNLFHNAPGGNTLGFHASHNITFPMQTSPTFINVRGDQAWIALNQGHLDVLDIEVIACTAILVLYANNYMLISPYLVNYSVYQFVIFEITFFHFSQLA